MEYPRMTYYARVIDNITNEEITGFTDATKYNAWYYGQVNGLEGGESQYIVEFDIWNNEPAFSANTGEEHCMDAKNCYFTVVPISGNEDSAKLFSLPQPFMKARLTTMGFKDNFVDIKNNDKKTMLKVTGNVNPYNEGIIQGNGDHAKIQTKIILPPNTGIGILRCSFKFAFYYDV